MAAAPPPEPALWALSPLSASESAFSDATLTSASEAASSAASDLLAALPGLLVPAFDAAFSEAAFSEGAFSSEEGTLSSLQGEGEGVREATGFFNDGDVDFLFGLPLLPLRRVLPSFRSLFGSFCHVSH